MNRALRLAVILLVFAAMHLPTPTLAQDTFSNAEREELRKELVAEAAVSVSHARANQIWDLTCKIAILVLSISAAAGTAYASALGQTAPPNWLKASNAISAVAVAALTTFAFSQFDFSRRHTVWRERAVQLDACRDMLMYLAPSKSTFLMQLRDVRRLGDATAVSELRVGCGANHRLAGSG